MKLTRCENGHFYDEEKYSACPHCAANDSDDSGVTLAVTDPDTNAYGAETVPDQGTVTGVAEGFAKALDEAVTVPTEPLKPTFILNEEEDRSAVSLKQAVSMAIQDNTKKGVQAADDDDNKTVGLFAAKGVDPVVGWLVCIQGKAFGDSFKLKSGRNFIGRSMSMDIVLEGDPSVSRERHAIVLYEPKHRQFLVQPGTSRELFYVNDQVVLAPAPIQANDILTIGNTALMFFPCCSEKFCWEDYMTEEEK